MTGPVFRRELAERLNEVLPDGFAASPTEDGVWLATPDGLGSEGWAGQIEQSPDDLEAFGAAAWTVLNSIQDGVCLTLHEWWPMSATAPRRDLPLPGTRVDGRVLRLWFGDEHAPTMQLRSIDLSD
jgi:hypothetical protein